MSNAEHPDHSRTGAPAEDDPVCTDGDKYRTIFENDQVRVLEYRDTPGAHPTAQASRQRDGDVVGLHEATPCQRCDEGVDDGGRDGTLVARPGPPGREHRHHRHARHVRRAERLAFPIRRRSRPTRTRDCLIASTPATTLSNRRTTAGQASNSSRHRDPGSTASSAGRPATHAAISCVDGEALRRRW